MAEQKKQLPFEDRRNKLYGPAVQGGKGRPTLTFGYVTRKFVNNMASITVKTNVPDDKDYGRITAEFPMAQMYTIFEMIEKAAREANYEQQSIRVYTDFAAGKKTDQPFPKANLIIGKEDDGRVYIALVAKNRPNIKFHIGPEEFYKLVVNGQELTTAEYYGMYATGYIKMIRAIYDNVVSTEFIPWYPDNNGGGNNNNGGGGNNNNNSNNGGDWGGDSGGDLW